MSRPYANAKDVLSPELLRTLQQHFTGLLWVPADTHFHAVRRKLVLALRDQGVSTIEIAKLAGVTPRRVRQILAKARTASPPTPPGASRREAVFVSGRNPSSTRTPIGGRQKARH